MTEKQSLVKRLNELRKALGEPPIAPKIAARRSIGVLRVNVELYEKLQNENA
jgi:hypothetical protein